MANKKQEAEATLEDLDVREVSVVDRPANRRRFLIVKRDDGSTDIVEENEMSRRAIPPHQREQHGLRRIEKPTVAVEKDEELAATADDDAEINVVEDLSAADLFELFPAEEVDAISQDEDETEPPVEEELESEIIAITKQSKAGEVLRAVNTWVGQLTSVVNQIRREEGAPAQASDEEKKKAASEDDGDKKKEEEEAKDKDKKKEKAATISAATAGKVSAISTAIKQWLSRVSGSDEGKTKDGKTQKAAAATATAALQRLMAASNTLKGMDAGAEVPAAIMSSLALVARTLDSVVSTHGPQQQNEDKKKTTKSERLKIFVEKSDTDDPELVLVGKAGAKMKRTRLSKLRQVMQILSSLLKEVDPESLKDEDKSKGKKKTTKVDDSDNRGTLDLSGLEGLIEKVVSASVDKLTDRFDSIEKRIDDIDTAPAGRSAEDPPDTEEAEMIEKKENQKPKSVFAGLGLA